MRNEQSRPWGLLAGPTAAIAMACAVVQAGAPGPRRRAEVEAVLARAPRTPQAAALRQLHIVLLADVADHGPGAHDYPVWQARWKLLLGGRRAGERSASQVNLHGPPRGSDQAETFAGARNVRVTTAWKWPSPEQFQTADVIAVFCYRSGGKPRCWSDDQIGTLQGYLSRGGGFVAIHPATYTLRDLSTAPGRRVAALTGLAFDRTIRVRHGRIALKIVAREHPICRGLPETINLFDEPYWPPLGDRRGVTVLATSDEQVGGGAPRRAPQPLFWASHRGKGRIFACVLGHFNWTFDDPYFRILVLRGMAWAAGESPYRFDPLVLRGAAVSD